MSKERRNIKRVEIQNSTRAICAKHHSTGLPSVDESTCQRPLSHGHGRLLPATPLAGAPPPAACPSPSVHLSPLSARSTAVATRSRFSPHAHYRLASERRCETASCSWRNRGCSPVGSSWKCLTRSVGIRRRRLVLNGDGCPRATWRRAQGVCRYAIAASACTGSRPDGTGGSASSLPFNGCPAL